MGVKHVIEFASRCAKLELVLLASTGEMIPEVVAAHFFPTKRISCQITKLFDCFQISAIVNLDKAGIMLEKPLQQYRSNDGRLDLDISEETAFAEAKLKELVCSNASEDTIRRTMKKIGTQRFHIYILIHHLQNSL